MLNLRGVDVAGVKAELQQYVEQTTPRNGSGNGFITTQSYATCGRPQALALSERVIPILDRLYPKWRDENEPDSNFEFGSERDAAMRLLARIESDEQISDLFSGQDDAPRLSAGAMHELIWNASSAQWSTGHRHEAVLAAAKPVNSRLQERLGRRDLADVKLVQEAFSNKDPEDGKPRLRFSGVEDDQTRESLRQGVLSFGVGCFQAIRNPVGHLQNDEHELTEQQALERLAALSLLLRWIDEATVMTAA
jgi:uncharacterized protein (TIGR02391 family)